MALRSSSRFHNRASEKQSARFGAQCRSDCGGSPPFIRISHSTEALAPNLHRRIIQIKDTTEINLWILGTDPSSLLFSHTVMDIFLRLLFLAGVCLLMVGPAQAQRGSDVSGNVPLSDQSGVAVNSDGVFFQSDEAKVRLNDVAASLIQALQSGQIGSSVMGESRSMTVSPMVIDLFSATSQKNVVATTKAFTDEMTANGLSKNEAKTLAETVAGLLNGGTVTPSQFRDALVAYNAAVDAAPADVLVQPPHDFIVVRSVLMTLLEGAV